MVLTVRLHCAASASSVSASGPGKIPRHVSAERLRPHHLSGEAHSSYLQAEIVGMAEKIAIDQRQIMRVSRPELYRPPCLRPQKAARESHTMGRRKPADIAVEIDGRHAIELDRGVLARAIWIDEGARLNARRRDRSRTEGQILQSMPKHCQAAILPEIAVRPACEDANLGPEHDLVKRAQLRRGHLLHSFNKALDRLALGRTRSGIERRIGKEISRERIPIGEGPGPQFKLPN